MLKAVGFIQVVLIREGTSDNGLKNLLEDCLVRRGFSEVDVQIINEKGPVGELLEVAMSEYPGVRVIFVHRDEDNAGRGARLSEINSAVCDVCSGLNESEKPEVIAVIPKTETESWILHALSRPDFREKMNYDVKDGIPKTSEVESISDAKKRLEDVVNAKWVRVFGSGRHRSPSFSGERMKLLTAIDSEDDMQKSDSFGLFVSVLESSIVPSA